MLKRSHPPVPSHSKQPSSLGFLQLQRLADSEWTKKATEVIRQHLEKEESEWEYGLLKQDPSSEKKLNLFLRSQKQLWPTRKTNLFHAIQTVNALRITLNSRKKTPPSLLVSYNEAGTMKTFIVADSIHVRCNNDSRVVLGYLMQLIGCYYA
ncbi:uncharacterized protein LOC143451900 isoform X1 [Clavelina lepadiformis]|uniref:uncharacterized protein LOC143451900 isoform X1 n=1 Tax=Clavelina lepadiformis TaxID=159417 RepID=UPI0040433C56